MFARLMMLSMVHNHAGAYGEALLGMSLSAEAMREWDAAEDAAMQVSASHALRTVRSVVSSLSQHTGATGKTPHEHLTHCNAFSA